MSIKVTGSHGFIGSLLCKRLRIPQENQYDLKINLDICNDGVQNSIVEGSDTVIHLAGISGLADCAKDETYSRIVNTESTISLANKAKKAGVKRFIFASSSAVYGEAQQYEMNEDHPTEPRSVYGMTKLSAESISRLSNSSFNVVILRKSNVFGWGLSWKGVTAIDAFVDSLINKRAIQIKGAGFQKRDFIHINDIVNLYSYLANTDNRVRSGVYNVGGNDCISIRALADLVNEVGESVLGYRVPITFLKDVVGAMSSHDFKYDWSKVRCETRYLPLLNIKYYVTERLMHNLRNE